MKNANQNHILTGIVSRKFDILFVSFGSLEVSTGTPFSILTVFKNIIVLYRIFKYTTFSGAFLSSHNAVNELCYVAQFVNSIVA
jgi:hypothetical protein